MTQTLATEALAHEQLNDVGSVVHPETRLAGHDPDPGGHREP